MRRHRKTECLVFFKRVPNLFRDRHNFVRSTLRGLASFRARVSGRRARRRTRSQSWFVELHIVVAREVGEPAGAPSRPQRGRRERRLRNKGPRDRARSATPKTTSRRHAERFRACHEQIQTADPHHAEVLNTKSRGEGEDLTRRCALCAFNTNEYCTNARKRLSCPMFQRQCSIVSFGLSSRQPRELAWSGCVAEPGGLACFPR